MAEESPSQSPLDSLLNQYIDFYKKEVVEDTESEDPEEEKKTLLTKYNFQLPIEYHESKTLNESVTSDLELEGSHNLYQNFFASTQQHIPLLMNKWSSLYTTKKGFLMDNQTLIQKYSQKTTNMDAFVASYLEFKGEQNFLNKYQYVQFRRLFFLNSITGFLQFLALYNIFSPLLSLCAPIIGLIIPYFVFYFKGIKLSFSNYLKMIKTMILNSNMVRNILNFRKGNMQQKLYACIYVFFYGMGVYNNVQSCVSFYHNTNFMIDFNEKYHTYLCQGDELIHHVYTQTKELDHFSDFNKTMMSYQKKIHHMRNVVHGLNQIQNKYMKCGQIGLLMKYNFDIFHNEEYHDSVMYLIYLNQFHMNMTDLSSLSSRKYINPCTFTETKKTKMKKMYYLPHMKKEPVKNNIQLDKNIMITGPNASGKTTLIKSTMMNLFLSQSIGFGCYKRCRINPYSYFHSYLNIPDTSNRDSLFQAEARRCKDIFTFVKKHNNERHLCIFDEIYSGTNPEDAVLCAKIYLNGMNEYKSNVDYVLTTHYLGLCESFNEDKSVKNQKMGVCEKDNDNIEYTYTLQNGISHVHGGYQVLKNLEYPSELMKQTEDS